MARRQPLRATSRCMLAPAGPGTTTCAGGNPGPREERVMVEMV